MHLRAALVCLCSAQTTGVTTRPAPALHPWIIFSQRLRWQYRSFSHAHDVRSSDENKDDQFRTVSVLGKGATFSPSQQWQEELGDPHLINTKDIFVDDLSATLEAHREANKSTIIRRVQANAEWEAPFLSPLADIDPIIEPNDDSIVGHDEESSPSAADEPAAYTENTIRKEIQSGRGLTHRQWTSIYWPADSVQLAQLTGKQYQKKPNEVLEYRACLLPTQGPFNLKKGKVQRPWLGFMEKPRMVQTGKSHQRLYEELKAYENYMSLSSTEEEAAALLIAQVNSIIGRRYPRNPVHVIGSYSTGLADRLSDFDFNLSFPEYEKGPLERGPSPTRLRARKAGGSALIRIQHLLGSLRQLFKDVELIHARVPIVKAEHIPTSLKVEIQTLSSTQNTREYIASYLAEFPTLRTLYVVVRSALHVRYLTNVRKGGLGSYSVFMMIVNALKHASGKFAHDDLANHFLHILEFYGNADLYKFGFSPDPPRTIPKQGRKMFSEEKGDQSQDPMLRGIEILELYQPQKPYLLFLQDPANPVNDLGRKAYGIKHVQYIFSDFAGSLRETMRLMDVGNIKTQGWIRSHGLLGNLLEANYSSLDIHRQRMQEWVKRKSADFPRISSIQRLEDLSQEGAPLRIDEISSIEVGNNGSEPDLELNKAMPTRQIDMNHTDSIPDTVVLEYEKAIPPPAVGAPQVLSQSIFQQTHPPNTRAKDDTKQETTGEQLSSNPGWKRWSPAYANPSPESKIAVLNDQALSDQKRDLHREILLTRLRKQNRVTLFEKVQDLDWPAFLNLKAKDLEQLGVDSASDRNKVTRIVQNYVSRVPYEELIALQDRRSEGPTGPAAPVSQPQSTTQFLQSLGLARHIKKLASRDLPQLAAMSRLDFKARNVPLVDVQKIARALQKDGIRPKERRPPTYIKEGPGSEGSMTNEGRVSALTMVSQIQVPSIASDDNNEHLGEIELQHASDEPLSPASDVSSANTESAVPGSSSVPLDLHQKAKSDETPDAASSDSLAAQPESSDSDNTASTPILSPKGISVFVDPGSKDDDPDIPKGLFWKIIDLVVAERHEGDRTAAIAAWRAYSSEERKEALHKAEERLAIKNAAKEMATADSAPPPDKSIKAQLSRNNTATKVSGSPPSTPLPFARLMQVIQREQNCIYPQAVKTWNSYTMEERRKLLRAYKEKESPADVHPKDGSRSVNISRVMTRPAAAVGEGSIHKHPATKGS